MKKTFLSLATTVALTFTGSVLAADHTGTITINGELVDSSCEVTGDYADGGNIYVDLDNLAVSTFTGIGSTIGEKNFTVDLKNCDLNRVKLKFFGESVAGQPNAIVNNLQAIADGGTGAANVGHYLKDSTGNFISVSEGSTPYITLTGDGASPQKYSGSIPLRAGYMQIADNPKGGLTDSVVDFDIVYE